MVGHHIPAFLSRSKRLLFALVFLGFLGPVCQCRTAEYNSTETSPAILLKVSTGISPTNLEQLIGVPARHQFTVLRSNETVRCVSYSFVSYNTCFFFVFTNDALGKIVLRPDYESARRGWRRAKRARWRTDEPDERLEVVLNAPALTRDDFLLASNEKYKPEVDPGLTLAAITAGIIASPVIIARTPERIAEHREMQALAKRFDPYRVRLGMTVAEMEQMFDAPHHTETLEDGSELRYYGSAKFGYYYDFHWVAIAYRNGKVNAVFSDDFCNQRKLEKRK